MALALALGFAGTAGRALAPSVADLDAAARASGNRRDVADRIGKSIFSVEWPAEVSHVSANELANHLFVGIRIWGVKFHWPMRREDFVDEVVAVTERAFAAAPDAEEVDVWASVPIAVGKGVVVSGDLAKPTSRTVFSVTVRHNEAPAALQARISAGDGVYWDQEWVRSAFKQAM